jgi:hypothetical protein
MKMTPLAVVVGSLLILATIVFVVVLLPYVQHQPDCAIGHFPPAGGR